MDLILGLKEPHKWPGCKALKKLFSLRKLQFQIFTVFENYRKSLINYGERSELRLHFQWAKTGGKCQNWKMTILAIFINFHNFFFISLAAKIRWSVTRVLQWDRDILNRGRKFSKDPLMVSHKLIFKEQFLGCKLL